MYLCFKIFIVLTLIIHSYENCGCNLNRNGKCSSDQDPSKKYSQESNELFLDNNLPFDSKNMVYIEGGTFEMGTNSPVFPSDHEGPIRNVTVDNFYLDKFEVSNENFYNFVKKTGYKTEAEIFGDSFLFEKALPEVDRDKYRDIRAVQAPWWIKMKGVAWKHPEGGQSTIEGIVDYYHHFSSILR